MGQKFSFIIGVDEAGRGPLAGPVAVGVVKVPKGFDWSQIEGVGDSKQMTEVERARVFARAKKLRHSGLIDFAVAQVGPSVIDEKGIMFAINLAMQRCIDKLQLDEKLVTFRLDGSLSAPSNFRQATIIKGDSLYPEIGLASIIAKETRDAYMRRIARRFFKYELEVHKGYGTKRHRELISKYGLSPIHRVSYCKNIKVGVDWELP